MQNIKLIILSFLTIYSLQVAQAKSNNGDILEAGGRVVDATKILFNGLPVLINQDKAQAELQDIEKKIKQALKNGEITEQEAKKQLRKNCMRMIDNPQDKIETFFSAAPIVGLLKGLDVLCPQYR